MPKERALVASPVYQKPAILALFLTSLKSLKMDSFVLDYLFVDDNADQNSSALLADFQREGSEVIILNSKEQGTYLCNDESHHWDDNLMLKVANYKNSMINYAIEMDYDYLFFVDSDLVLYPGLVEHLKTKKKDILSEIFWTKWHPDQPPEPNVWLFDEYDLVPKNPGETLNQKEMEIRRNRFLHQLRIPGLYEVGGLGACTLISRSALLKGVSFQPIRNLTIHGEDRFFCIRAVVLGLDLFVDTYYPAFHIYREQDLAAAKTYLQSNAQNLTFVRRFKTQGNKITLSMIVKNEEGRYLERVLRSLVGHIDAAVMIDDGSTDHTIAICREILKGIPLRLIENDHSLFAQEVSLRKQQWEETIKTNPDWILNLDADEILEESFWLHAQELINNPDCDLYCFRLYDMWDEKHYREDAYWNAHLSYRPFLLRYQPDFAYQWNETPQHCGRFPANIFSFPALHAEARIQHFGWAVAADRIEKKKRYELLDPDAIYGIKEQYDSILDSSPRLLPWQEEDN
ncbi:MAG: glycosyltransferase [Negativicutes bacterium]|nr:glycosyltransferase [Negativicutes bacterium]